ncbi:hypothetical protein [Lentzea sp. CA-135723]|uniref:hypothetical protein n=1 Tax=Lentzea sp. CA-135723 TaxID=3239950 RepID=UPI003D91B01E
MDVSYLGLGIAIAAAIPGLTVVAVSLIALWGSTPAQRPEIIRALADLIRAQRRGRDSQPGLRARKNRRPRGRGGSDVTAEVSRS